MKQGKCLIVTGGLTPLVVSIRNMDHEKSGHAKTGGFRDVGIQKNVDIGWTEYKTNADVMEGIGEERALERMRNKKEREKREMDWSHYERIHAI